MGTYRRIEHPLFQAYDSNGDPLSGGLVYTYAAGTDTPKATYQEDDTENANPVVLDSTGRAEIYGTGYYKFVLKTSAGVTIWTLDNVQGIGETAFTTIGDYANDFDAAITVIGATETTLYVDDTATMSANVTVPATCSVVVLKGGSIDQSTYTLTINGPFDAGRYQVFTGTGDVTFGTGAVLCVYPEWWGANSVPGTTDMTTEIQAAIDSITAGEVFFHGETYTISSPLIPESYVNLVGMGGATIKLAANSDDDMLDFTGSDTDVGFYNLIFDNNGANQTKSTATNTIHATTQVKRLTIKNCTFKGSASSALLLNASLAHEDVIISGNKFIDYYQTAVTFWGVVRGEINNNIFDNTGVSPSGNGNGISVSNISTDIVVSDNTISMGESGAESFGIETGTSGTTRVTITGNTVNAGDYANHGGISIAETTNSTVSGNSITKTQTIAAIELSKSSNITVSGNSIYDIDSPGIAVNGANHTISISGNSIDAFTEQGISFVSGTGVSDVYAISVVGNTISNGTGVAASGYHAIYVGGAPEYGLVIANNVIYNIADAWAINIVAQATKTHYGTIVSGNSIYDCTTYWLGLTGTGTHSTYTIVGNNIQDSSVDLYIEGSGHIIANNSPSVQSLTGTATINRYSLAGDIDSSGGAVTATLGDGYFIGQIKTIVMSDASASSTVTVTHCDNITGLPLATGIGGDGEVGTFDAVDEAWILMWTGTEWTTLRATCTFV